MDAQEAVLARRSYRWMLDSGARHDYEAKRRSYTTRDSWAQEMNEQGFDVEPNDLLGVVCNIFRLPRRQRPQGLFVGFAYGKGFYLCEPSDSATYITRLINYYQSLGKTINRVLESMRNSGEFPEIAEGIPGRVRLADLKQLPDSLEQLGIPIEDDVRGMLVDAQLLLTARIEASHEE
jgi:hypothetical protein